MAKERIIEVATSLYMKYGIRSVSMDDVSRALGISKKTLYTHVSTKNELVRLVVQAHKQQECQDMQVIIAETDDALDTLVNMGQYIIQMVKKIKPGVMYDLQKYYGGIYHEWDEEHGTFVREKIIQNLKRGIEQGYYRKEMNVEIISRFYVGKVQLLMNKSIFPPDEFKQEDVVIEHYLYHLHGILTPKGLDKLDKENLLLKITG